jgi:pimeloyl-ACP methyl ester carboxylesterase
MHYYAVGPADGPVVVLVHGLGGRAEDWRNLAPYLPMPAIAFICLTCPDTDERMAGGLFLFCAR